MWLLLQNQIPGWSFRFRLRNRRIPVIEVLGELTAGRAVLLTSRRLRGCKSDRGEDGAAKITPYQSWMGAHAEKDSAVPTGLGTPFCRFPGTGVPGYFVSSLRD